MFFLTGKQQALNMVYTSSSLTSDHYKIWVDGDTFLEELKSDDLSELFDALKKNRSHLHLHFNWMENLNTMYEFINWSLEEQKNKRNLIFIVRKKSNIIGTIGFNDFNWENRSSSIKYWIDKNMQGFGIATNACRAIISYGFLILGLKNISIYSAVDNKKSQSIASKLNFLSSKYIKNFIISYGEYKDCIEYMISDVTWQKFYNFQFTANPKPQNKTKKEVLFLFEKTSSFFGFNYFKNKFFKFKTLVRFFIDLIYGKITKPVNLK